MGVIILKILTCTYTCIFKVFSSVLSFGPDNSSVLRVKQVSFGEEWVIKPHTVSWGRENIDNLTILIYSKDTIKKSKIPNILGEDNCNI